MRHASPAGGCGRKTRVLRCAVDGTPARSARLVEPRRPPRCRRAADRGTRRPRRVAPPDRRGGRRPQQLGGPVPLRRSGRPACGRSSSDGWARSTSDAWRSSPIDPTRTCRSSCAPSSTRSRPPSASRSTGRGTSASSTSCCRESSLGQLLVVETTYNRGLRCILHLIGEHLDGRNPTERDEVIELATALAIRGFADFERKRDRGLRPPDLTVDVVADLICESSLGVLTARAIEPHRATT